MTSFSWKQILTSAHAPDSASHRPRLRASRWNIGVKILSALCWITAAAVLAGTTVLSWNAHAGTAEPTWQSLESIRRAATRYVEANAQTSDRDFQVSASNLDPRLRLQRCERELEAYLSPGAQIGTNTTVGVRCSGPKRWKLYVPVRMSIRADVLIARKSLEAGSVLTPEDFVTARRDIASLHGGYRLASEPVTGLVLKRRLSEGQPLRASLLTTPRIVRRGQALSIVSGASNGSVAIRMAGTALSDGRLGERIRVKNRSSGRTVEGIVRSSERVEVAF